MNSIEIIIVLIYYHSEIIDDYFSSIPQSDFKLYLCRNDAEHQCVFPEIQHMNEGKIHPLL